MYKQLTIFLLLLLFSTNAHSFSQSDTKVAMQFVAKTKLNNSLYDVGYKRIVKTNTYKKMLKKHGEQKTTRIIKAQLSSSIGKYQQRWKKSIANAFLIHFTPSELKSLYQKKGKSPYAKKLKTKKQAIVNSMKSKSLPILKDLVNEVTRKAVYRR